MDDKKEACFKIIDDFIDQGIDVTNLKEEIGDEKYETLRKRFFRTFGTARIDVVLAEYGLYSSNGTPSDIELYRCYEINQNFEVVRNEYIIEELLDLYNLSDVDFRRLSKPIRNGLEIDAADSFYREYFPFNETTSKTIRYEFPKVYTYITKHYGTFINFVNIYGFPYSVFVDREYGKRESIKRGHTFEQRLGVILESVYGNVERQPRINGCRPDFIVNGTSWIDAKLGKNSVFDTRCLTLHKYLEHTNHITIYYAIQRKDPIITDDYAILHVSELYPALRKKGRCDLIDDMERLLKSWARRRVS